MKGNGVGGKCARCEAAPERPGGSGRLYLWPPLGHTGSKVKKLLRAEGWSRLPADGDHLVAVRIGEGSLSNLLAALSELLTARELEDTLALFKAEGEDPCANDIPKAQSLGQLAALDRSGWLLDMLSEGRLTSHFQPIVQTDDPSEVYAQECLMRGLDPNGNLVSPAKILEAAKACDMLFQTDLAARRTAIREAVRHGLGGGIFINFTPTSIYDPRFCLRSTVEAVDRAGMAHESVVFEITESERTKDLGHLKNIVDYYRESGFKVALDDVGSGYSSLNLVHRLRPDYIKLDMQLIRDVHSDPYKAVVARKVLEMAQELDTQTIVEGVESREEFFWAKEHGATFAQGYLFSKPVSPPRTALPTFEENAIDGSTRRRVGA